MSTESLHINNGSGKPTIGVIGAGVVGGIVASYFRDEGYPVVAYDKYRPVDTVEQVNEASLVFICVPTPYVEGKGLDYSAIDESFGLLTGSKTVVVKSTVLPGTTASLAEAYPAHRVFFNPEFLREKTAAQDFIEPDRQIVGYTRETDRRLANEIMSMLPPAPFEAIVTASEAEMIKVSTNSFLALKVIFANEIFDLCNALSIDYETVKAGLYADARLGGSHFDVYDSGYRGFGGKCLPKDSSGLIEKAIAAGSPLRLMEVAAEVNEELFNRPVPAQKAA